MQLFMREIERDAAIINLDFANDHLPYSPSIDVRDFISLQVLLSTATFALCHEELQSAMDDYDLGPNGGLLFCMESLLDEIDWLLERIRSLPNNYFIFDFPGQVELYSHHDCCHRLLETISKSLDCRMCCVQLVDSFYCR